MVTVYRKDDLTGIELEGTGLKLDDMLANGYTTDKSEAVALSTTAGGSNFTGGGEPTVHPQYHEIVEYAKAV